MAVSFPRIPARNWKSYFAFAHDIILAAIALPAATVLRLGGIDYEVLQAVATKGLPIFIGIIAVCYLASGMYKGIWSYSSMGDLVAITKANTAAILIFTLSMFLFNRLEDIPRSVPIITWFVLMALIGGPRFFYRLVRDHRLVSAIRGNPGVGTPVLLIGAGDGAELFIRAVRGDRSPAYDIVGTIDQKGSRVGRMIHGVPILGGLDELAGILEGLEWSRRRPRRIVLTSAPGRLDGPAVRRILGIADAQGIAVSRLPRITHLTGNLTADELELRPITLEDLLGRAPATLDRAPLRDLISGARIIVTGAGGSIGSELARQIAALNPARLVLLDNSEFHLYQIDQEIESRYPELNSEIVLRDVRDRTAVQRLFAAERPDLVFHAAALKHVPIVEINPHEGILTNVVGTRNVADAAMAVGVKAMVLISTDKAVKPSSVMGASKRIAEAYCQALDKAAAESPEDSTVMPTRFVTVRFGNVLGSNGSVIPLFQRQLAAGGPLTVTHPDIERYFMTIREAVELVMRATVLGLETGRTRGEIYVLDMGTPVKIATLAKELIRLAGLKPDVDVKIVYTGLRRGEKLHEELFSADEPSLPTEVAGILVGAPREIALAFLNRAIDELQDAALAADDATQHRVIETIVQDFRHATNLPPAALQTVDQPPAG